MLVFSINASFSQVLQKTKLSSLNRSLTGYKSIESNTSAHEIIWSDDFSENKNWAISNDEGNFQNWKLTTFNPMGSYSGSMGKIKSDTPNKFALMDADYIGNGTNKQRAKLTNASPINCSSNEKVFVRFNSYYSSLSTKVFFRVSNNNGQTWTSFEIHEDLLDMHLSLNPEIIRIDISEQAAGYEEVLIQFYFDGLDDNWGIAWMVDDIELYEPQGLVAEVLSINSYWIMGTSESFEFTATLQNFGSVNINSITFSYQINEFESEFETLEGLNIKPFDKYELKHTEIYNFINEGAYTPSFKISHINGKEFRLSGTGDYIEVYDNIGKNALVGELFTSSTCSPCASFNPFYDLVQSFISPTILSTVKYQMNWPDNGDPYFTQEGQIRKQYYNVNSVPNLYVNGEYVDLNNYGIDYIRNMLRQPSDVSVNINGAVNNSMVSVDLDILSTEDLTDCYLFVSVNEKQTHENTGSNGETEFNHVMMKMLSGSEGIDLSNLLIDESKLFDFLYDMNNTNVEELNDLEVVAFIQNISTNEILQSTSLDLSWEEEGVLNNVDAKSNSINIYPNPASNFFTVNYKGEYELVIYNELGNKIHDHKNCFGDQIMNISAYNKGLYFVTLIHDNKVEVQKLLITK